MQLLNRIKHLRKKKGLTQSQLAEIVKVDSSLICKIEKGESAGSVSTLKKIAIALDVSFDDLFSMKGSNKKIG